MAYKAAVFEAIVVPGTVQIGESGVKKTLTVSAMVQIPALEDTMQTYLHFSPASLQYSIEKLRVTGWEGKTIVELGTKWATAFTKKFQVKVYEDSYDGKTNWKCEIVGGRVELENPMDPATFAQRIAALSGDLAPGTGGAAAGGGKVPF